MSRNYKLVRITWDDYLYTKSSALGMRGIPQFFTINPSTNELVLWPKPFRDDQLVSITVELKDL
jgi:hypothetical protein